MPVSIPCPSEQLRQQMLADLEKLSRGDPELDPDDPDPLRRGSMVYVLKAFSDLCAPREPEAYSADAPVPRWIHERLHTAICNVMNSVERSHAPLDDHPVPRDVVERSVNSREGWRRTHIWRAEFTPPDELIWNEAFGFTAAGNSNSVTTYRDNHRNALVAVLSEKGAKAAGLSEKGGKVEWLVKAFKVMQGTIYKWMNQAQKLWDRQA